MPQQAAKGAYPDMTCSRSQKEVDNKQNLSR